MTDPQTTVLYALSTFAQTCAALAAFVGAVGLFKLQLLANEHARVEHNIRGILGGTVTSRMEVSNLPLDEVIEIARSNSKEGPHAAPATSARLRVALAEWDRQPCRRTNATTALLIFEGWNLLLIGFSLVGFSHVPAFAACWATWWAIWVGGVGTVCVTGYALLAWLIEWSPVRRATLPP